VKGGLRIVAVNGAAAAAGIRPGQRLADARALVPSLEVQERDAAGDAARLTRLAEWATRYTPWTRAEEVPAAHEGCGLLLDISGCAHLFGGEEALLEDLLGRMAWLGHDARAAVADTVGAAWAVARCSQERMRIVKAGAAQAAVAPLPLMSLRISQEMSDDLGRLGLVTIGDLVARPRAPLVARFGALLGQRLDQALGVRGEPVAPDAVRVPARARLLFADPLIALDGIVAAITLAARDLSTELVRRQQGARRLRLQLYRVDGERFSFDAGASSALQDADRVAALFAEKLVPAGGLSGADIDVGYGIEGVVLEARAVDAVAERQTDLTEEHADGSSLEELIDRLSNRLGANRVIQLTARASHLPERAQVSVPAVSARDVAGDVAAEDGVPPLVMYGDAPLRPIRMLMPPEPVEVVAEVPEGPPRQFRWRRMLHAVAKAEGPERLAPEWWQAADRSSVTRDYYRVEDEAGRRFWIYRDGLYERETASPRWFMHGVFA
jgi:protein ImuB